jgi:hypothetical protein
MKYGITSSVLPVIVGDYINDNLSEINKTKCSDGKLKIEGILKEIELTYVIDCKLGKSISVVPEYGLNEGDIEIKYGEFIKNGNTITPGRIEIKDLQRMTTIIIKILKIVTPWNGKIEFIPGNNYEIIQLR